MIYFGVMKAFIENYLFAVYKEKIKIRLYFKMIGKPNLKFFNWPSRSKRVFGECHINEVLKFEKLIYRALFFGGWILDLTTLYLEE